METKQSVYGCHGVQVLLWASGTHDPAFHVQVRQRVQQVSPIYAKAQKAEQDAEPEAVAKLMFKKGSTHKVLQWHPQSGRRHPLLLLPSSNDETCAEGPYSAVGTVL